MEVRTPVGAPHFRVRFTPERSGTWRWYWEVTTPAGEVQSEKRRLRVERSKRRGFLRRSSRDGRYLAYDDGSSYFAIGENLGWTTRAAPTPTTHWLGELAAQGATWGRLWMPSWSMGIEWNDTGLGDYTARLDRAWQLDTVLAEAERQGIAVSSCSRTTVRSRRSRTASGPTTPTTRRTADRSRAPASSGPTPRRKDALPATPALRRRALGLLDGAPGLGALERGRARRRLRERHGGARWHREMADVPARPRPAGATS